MLKTTPTQLLLVKTLSNFIDFCNCLTSGRRFAFSSPETMRLLAKFLSAVVRFVADAALWPPEALKFNQQQQCTTKH